MCNQRIINWVKNIDNEDKKVLFVYGEIGTGKSNFIEDNLKEDYKINTFTYIDFLYGKNIAKVITQTNNTNNVFFMMSQKRKPIILIKEVEFIKTKTIKNILKELNVKNIKKNQNRIKIPIILVGSGQCIKTKKDLHDICEIIEFKKQDINIQRIVNKNNIVIDEKINEYIINKSNGNYNKINMIINFIKNYANKNNKIIYKNVKKILELINNIEYNTELYDNVKELLTNEIKINDIFNYFYLEKILLPLLIHENYKTYILKNINKEDINVCIREISINLMKCDIINEFIFNNHIWNIQDLFAIQNCQYTSYLINTKFSTKIKKIKPMLDYTKILTKNSVLFMNFKQYKTIIHTINYEHNYDKTLIEFINKNIIINLTNNIKIGKKYLEEYGFDKKDLLKIIKFSNECYFLNRSNDIKKTIEKSLKKIK
jgi:hypothetical protein